MAFQKRPAWKAMPCSNRHGMEAPIIFFPTRQIGRDADQGLLLVLRPHPDRELGVAAQAQRHLGEGGVVELLHDAHAGGVDAGARLVKELT